MDLEQALDVGFQPSPQPESSAQTQLTQFDAKPYL